MKKELKKVNNKKEKCPRCGKAKDNPGALSRRTDIYICGECGREEAYIDAGSMDTTLNEKKFLAKLGKKSNPTQKEIADFIHKKRLERFGSIVGNTNKKKNGGSYVKKIKKIKVLPSATGYQMFPYLNEQDCSNAKHVMETVLIFTNYKLSEIQYFSGINELEFMRTLYWLSQYEFVYSEQANLKTFLSSEISQMQSQINN